MLATAKEAMTMDKSLDARVEYTLALINLHRVDELRVECAFLEENAQEPVPRAVGRGG